MLLSLNNFMKYFELLFLCYQSKGINKKHQKKFEHIEITIILSRKADTEFPRNYLTRPSNTFMILIFIFHQIYGFIILVIASKFTIFSYQETYTAKNTVILPDFLVRKFCGKVQFLHSLRRISQNYAETVPLLCLCTPGNQLKT